VLENFTWCRKKEVDHQLKFVSKVCKVWMQISKTSKSKTFVKKTTSIIIIIIDSIPNNREFGYIELNCWSLEILLSLRSHKNLEWKKKTFKVVLNRGVWSLSHWNIRFYTWSWFVTCKKRRLARTSPDRGSN
jgi:hypothetical protein